MKQRNDKIKGIVRRLIIHREFNIWVSLLATLLIMAALIASVYLLKIPNPNMILIAGLVICSAIFGYKGGVLAGVIMLLYTLYFFSAGNDFFTFSEQNAQKVLVSLFGIVVDMIFVCELKRKESLFFREVNALSEKLRKENENLDRLSHVDVLTGIRNRLSLRTSFESYYGREIAVMMLDVDDFKSINDVYGHFSGDSVLKATGEMLSEIFGADCCFRYGGDEFLVIDADSDSKSFDKKAADLKEREKQISETFAPIKAGYSFGYVRGVAADNNELRSMIAEADMKMYAEKEKKKKVTE